jgi:hypothetical protein
MIYKRTLTLQTKRVGVAWWKSVFKKFKAESQRQGENAKQWQVA